jgi:hypothetical protein
MLFYVLCLFVLFSFILFTYLLFILFCFVYLFRLPFTKNNKEIVPSFLDLAIEFRDAAKNHLQHLMVKSKTKQKEKKEKKENI